MAIDGPSASAAADHHLVRISRVASRYMIFDIDDVMFLRRHHNLCSVFSGTVPQNPQQNVFMGLPVELMAEEARALVDDGAAYVVEDADFHLNILKQLTKNAQERSQAGASEETLAKQKQEYLDEVTEEGNTVMQAYIEEKQALREASLLKASKSKKNKKGKKGDNGDSKTDVQTAEGQTSALDTKTPAEDADDGGLFSAEAPAPTMPQKINKAPQNDFSVPFAVTPTTTGAFINDAPGSSSTSVVDVPPSYPLYKHLHDKAYYMMPGLRFGCDYNVYPGDPLRFHAHFQATSYDWDEEIDMMDLTAGGRLGTGVKKGWLVGGGRPQGDEQGKDKQLVRTFCMEWAGM